MQGLVSIVFVVVISAVFAILYMLRIHVDYRIHILESDDADKPIPLKYLMQLIIMGLLIWALHALAIATSKETNQEIIRFLSSATDWSIKRLKEYLSVPSLIFLVLLVSLHFIVNFFKRLQKKKIVPKKIFFNKTIDVLSEVSLLLVILIILLFLTLIFSSINKYIALNLPSSLAGIIGDMLLALGLMAIVVTFFSALASPYFIKRRLKKHPETVTPEGKTIMSSKGIWTEVGGTHIKDAVWYGLIYAFVPCLLFRWAAFLPEYPLKSHVLFLIVLVVLHIVGAAVGGMLDWLEIQKLRTYEYRRIQYPYNWQVDRNMWFTRIKDMVIIIPVVIASWAYFLWRLLKTLPQS